MPENVRGQMRLAQEEVTVNVAGSDRIGQVRAPGFVLIHPLDLAIYIRYKKVLDLMVRKDKTIATEFKKALGQVKAAELSARSP